MDVACGTCVVLPQPVSPLMTTTRFATMTSRSAPAIRAAGSLISSRLRLPSDAR